jgi:hypothetical protein
MISNLRDRLVHRGTVRGPDGRSRVIRQRAGRRGLPDDVEERIDPETLTRLLSDVETIRLRLVCHFSSRGWPAVNRDVICEEARRAWRYKL